MYIWVWVCHGVLLAWWAVVGCGGWISRGCAVTHTQYTLPIEILYSLVAQLIVKLEEDVSCPHAPLPALSLFSPFPAWSFLPDVQNVPLKLAFIATGLQHLSSVPPAYNKSATFFSFFSLLDALSILHSLRFPTRSNGQAGAGPEVQAAGGGGAHGGSQLRPAPPAARLCVTAEKMVDLIVLICKDSFINVVTLVSSRSV